MPIWLCRPEMWTIQHTCIYQNKKLRPDKVQCKKIKAPMHKNDYSPSMSIKVQNFTDGWKLGILIFARAKRLAQNENRIRTKTQTKPYQK